MGSNSSHYIVKNKDTNQLETICLESGEVISRAGVDLSVYRFNLDTAMLICQKVREGMTMQAVSNELGVDLSVIHYWQRANSNFAEEIKLARKDRADYYHDKVISIANEISDKDDVPVAKFKVDQYKWAAEKGNPDMYGAKTQVSGSIENKVSMIVLNTGINRIKKDIEVQYEQKDEGTSGQQITGTDGKGVSANGQTEEGDSTSGDSEE